MHVAPDPKDGQRCPFLPVTTPTLVDAYTTLVGRQAMSSRESFSRNNRQDSLTRLVIQGHSSSVRTDCARIGGSYSPFPRGSPGSRWKCDASNPAGPCIYIYNGLRVPSPRYVLRTTGGRTHAHGRSPAPVGVCSFCDPAVPLVIACAVFEM